MSTRAQNNWPNHQRPAITRRGVLMGVLGLAASILAATAGQITSTPSQHGGLMLSSAALMRGMQGNQQDTPQISTPSAAST